MQTTSAPSTEISPELSAAQAMFQARRYTLALEAAEQLDPALPSTHYLRILCLAALGADRAAADAARAAIALFPGHAVLAALAGATLTRSGDLDEAGAVLDACLQASPDNAQVWTYQASLLLARREYAAAAQAARRAVSLAPGNVAALSAHGVALKETGNAVAAIDVFRQALAIDPANVINQSNLLFCMLFDPGVDPLALRREAVTAATLLAQTAPAGDATPLPAASDTAPIRLGVLSSDLRQHPCAYFLIPLIAALDRTRVEVVCIAMSARTDAVTDKIRRHADRFVSVAGASDATVQATVRDLNLDALIDLGGHTDGSPLRHMVRQLARIQITWLGYPGTTGVPAMQFRISDAVADPTGNDAFYTEALWRSPGVFCPYAPLVQAPLKAFAPAYRVAPTPALRNGHVTFGSCNNLGKITADTIRMWSAVLARCPGSRLLVEAAGVDDPSVSAPLLARMTDAGIDPARVSLVPRLTSNQYLTYHDIDIVLDSFPLTGGTTTCDALWMGVPVVTLAGQAFHSRMSATFLQAVDLLGLVCHDEAGYADVAAQLAGDVAALDALRQSIRPRFEASAIPDGGRFAHWLTDQLATALGRDAVAAAESLPERLFVNGASYTVAQVLNSVGVLLAQRLHVELHTLLDYVAARWYCHWVLPYAMSEMAHQDGRIADAADLLVQAIALHPGHLPLYRQLAAHMDALGHDKAELDALLQAQFSIPLQALEASMTADAQTCLGLRAATPAPRPVDASQFEPA